MIRTDELMLGDSVLIDGVPRIVAAITKKKVGYHRKPNESKMWYARLSEVQPRPLNEKLTSTFNHFSGRNAYIYWDDRCEDCDHQYAMIIGGSEFKVRYAHEVRRIANVFGLKQCILEGYWE